MIGVMTAFVEPWSVLFASIAVLVVVRALVLLRIPATKGSESILAPLVVKEKGEVSVEAAVVPLGPVVALFWFGSV